MSNNIVPISKDAQFPLRPEGAYAKDGYVYVVEFSDGTVKVGRARSLRGRLGGHRHDAAKFGMSISRWWGSDLHRGYEANEKSLVDYANATGGIRGGREYFADLDFPDVVDFAKSLPMHPTPPEQAESEAEQSKSDTEEFLGTLFPNSKYPRIYVDSWHAAVALGAFFDPTEDLPDLGGDIIPETADGLSELAEGIAIDRGVPVNEIMAWSAYEWLCHLLDTAVHSAKLGMRIRIHEEGRDDLHEGWALSGDAA